MPRGAFRQRRKRRRAEEAKLDGLTKYRIHTLLSLLLTIRIQRITTHEEKKRYFSRFVCVRRTFLQLTCIASTSPDICSLFFSSPFCFGHLWLLYSSCPEVSATQNWSLVGAIRELRRREPLKWAFMSESAADPKGFFLLGPKTTF